MKAVWKLIETCIIPILTYAGETRTPNKTENKAINDILDNTIKRVLMVPRTTPREAIYIETGLMDVEHTTMKNRINMDKRLSLNPESITYKAKENGARKGWKHTTQQIKDRLDINNQDMEGTRNLVKTNVREKTKAAFKESIDRNGAEKSKIQHLMNTKNNQWEPGKPAPYIMELTRMQASTIFKAKTRMLHVKENYKGKYQNRPDKLKCRACGLTEETQNHILNECTTLHLEDSTKVSQENLKTEDVNALRTASQKIMKTIKRLEDIHKEPLKNPLTKSKTKQRPPKTTK